MALLDASSYYFSIFLFFIAALAFLYASVGHGGASGYLALLAIFSVSPALMKSSALLLNVFVSLIAFYQFYREGYFKWELFLPFACASIPAAYFGAQLPLSESIYKKILGICLLLSVLRLVMDNKEITETVKLKWIYGLIVGAFIGFLSGMIGIGGGIILSPVILLFRWGNMKETAAVSALFIFVNSISGLLGLFSKGIVIQQTMYFWLIAAIVGGSFGAYLGAKRFNFKVLKYILAFVLCIASVKLMFT